MHNHYYSFETIEKDDKKLNIGKFSKILGDFKIPIPHTKIAEVFKKFVIGKNLMNLQEFFLAME
jgi:hypothetical protein